MIALSLCRPDGLETLFVCCCKATFSFFIFFFVSCEIFQRFSKCLNLDESNNQAHSFENNYHSSGSLIVDLKARHHIVFRQNLTPDWKQGFAQPGLHRAWCSSRTVVFRRAAWRCTGAGCTTPAWPRDSTHPWYDPGPCGWDAGRLLHIAWCGVQICPWGGSLHQDPHGRCGPSVFGLRSHTDRGETQGTKKEKR